MFILSKKEAEKKALAVTIEGMHFKGQYLPKESFNILGKKVKFICKAFNYAIVVEYKKEEFFISEDLIKQQAP